jgi:cytochrome c-type biogenesis protein CcmI
MTLFWIFCAVLLLLALPFVVWPLWRKSAANNDVLRDAANLEILRDQAAELEADLNNSLLTQDAFEQGRRELQVRLLDEVRTGLDREYRPDGYNIGLNNGVAAGQTVMHVHMHLIPRYAGDATAPRGGVRWIFPDKAAYWK